MKKLKQFFARLNSYARTVLNSLEEKYLFRYGKRAWQVVSLLAVSSLIVAISIYSYNTLPSYREKVNISNIEFQKNQIDLDFDESNDIEPCTVDEYKKHIGLLKKAMPNSEWVKIGDSIDVVEYEYRERYSAYFDYSYYDRVPYTVKVYKKNDDAIPNVLEAIFDAKGIDTFRLCERIETIKLIGSLNALVKKEEATRFLRYGFEPFIVYNSNLKVKNVKDVSELFTKIEGRAPKFKDLDNEKDDWFVFRKYLDPYDNDTITDERISYLMSTVSSINQTRKIIKPEIKHAIIRMILTNKMRDEDVFNAVDDFFSINVISYSEKTVIETLQKYLRLYGQKVNLAEKLLADDEIEKERNRTFYKYFGLVSFASVLSIATILLLFSIRNILKEKDN